MTISFPAGRPSSLHRLHLLVRRNISRQHARNIRFNSSKPQPSQSSPSHPNNDNVSSATAWIAPFRVPFRAYEDMQNRSPLITQLETTMIIFLLGDLSAQAFQTDFFRESRYEPIRSLRALLIGGIGSIPSYKFFMWLGRNFNYSSHILSLGAKILVSQSLFTPVFNTYFFSMQCLLTGVSTRDTIERIKTTVPVSWANSWKIWPLVTAFSFTFIRPQNRAPFSGVIAIGWQTYLSWLNRRAEKSGAKAVQAGKEVTMKMAKKT